MSTRSVIARKTDTGFAGVYHHWDGYPSGLGDTLYHVCREVYAGNVERMLQYLIDLHTGGWSTINKDWRYPEGKSPDRDTLVCEVCGKMVWEHYRQYYRENTGSAIPSAWERAGRPAIPDSSDEFGVMVLGHQPKTTEPKSGPEPFGGKDSLITQADASECGCEWAYVFEGSTMEVWSSFCDPDGKHAGSKMVGFFGCGDPKATWRCVARVDLSGAEPDWQAMDNATTLTEAA